MEIVIQQKGIEDLGKGSQQASFEIFSTNKLYSPQILRLCQVLFAGESHGIEDFDINLKTSLPHKYLYKVKIVNAGSE